MVLVTGNGLKDVGSAIKASGAPHLIEPSLDGLKRLMGKLAHGSHLKLTRGDKACILREPGSFHVGLLGNARLFPSPYAQMRFTVE